jgi:acyl-homoserine lactone acylase PvdQ
MCARRLGRLILSSNIIAGDSKGDIVYQQTGQVRKRRWNGFVPWLGWRGEPYDGELDWRTYTTVKNPASGFLTTANNDVRLDMLGADAAATPIVNAHMGDHRVARISELLPKTAKHDEASMLALLADTRVNFAPAFIAVLRDTLAARTDNVTRILRDWDVRAEVDSLGCTIFHRVYDALHTQLTGAALGADAWRHIRYDTPLFVDFSQHWDRALLREDLLFNATHTREREFARVANACSTVWRLLKSCRGASRSSM